MAKPVSFTQVSGFEMRSSDKFSVTFPDDNEINLIGGTFPAISVEHPIFNLEKHEEDFGPGCKLIFPKRANNPMTLDITFTNDAMLSIRKYLTSWALGYNGSGAITDFNLWRREAVPPKLLMKYCKRVRVDEWSNDKTSIINTKTFIVFMGDTLQNSLSNQPQVQNNQVQFAVVGLE